MDDRKLLEAAARANGYKGVDKLPRVGYVAIGGNGRPCGRFNPLESDADAFLLMVDLGLSAHAVRVHPTHGNPGGESHNRQKTVRAFCGLSDVGGDYRAAVRRAIVMAAAKLVEGED